jgi:hypothetical protein
MTSLVAAINLDQPGRYLHWNIFTVSLANLVLIVVMVVIFGLALVLPFPRDREERTMPSAALPSEPGSGAGVEPSDDGDATTRSMWTARLRRRIVRVFPPEKVLPDRQPAYVSSWVYVFGVASLAALAVAVASGLVIALGGVDWWHTNPVGHFFNSLHLWSVEMFMALLVIHLWGKFWMAAWRGQRGWTWITGVVAFVASIVEAFTGYLSQQNFDSQWISTNGKDAFNAAGVGAFFNLLNFGQMLLWHVVLLPLVLVAVIGAHVLLVRAKGVVRPLDHGKDATTGRSLSRRARTALEASPWHGSTRRYDIVKEGVVATGIVLVLVVLLAGLLSSPDEPPVTIRSWSTIAPADFMATAASELAGTSETATYGPPYNHANGSVQRLGFSPQQAAGVRLPVDAPEDFVLSPLTKAEATDAKLDHALRTYRSATPPQRQVWNDAYAKAVTHAHQVNGTWVVPKAADGPIPIMISTELTLAQNGGLDADLIARHPFYGTDFTKPLLFLEDGEYYAAKAQAQHLTGDQWGVMNETGSYPGQPWLWLYQLWYQVPGIRNSSNIDLIAIYLTGIATILLLLVPFIPGLRDIPRWVPIHRLVWRSWYHRSDRGPDEPQPPAAPSGPSTPHLGIDAPVPAE